MLFALFAFVIYYNLLNLGESWIASGQFGLAGYLLLLHGGVLLGSLLWLAKRHYNWSLLKRTRPGAATTAATTAEAAT
jgi:lipopolysaccharide export system permease protein